MKRILLVLAIALVSFKGMAQKNVIKLNVPQLVTGGLVLQYERKLIPLIRGQVGIGLYGRNDINQFGLPTIEALGVKLGGTVFQGELRLYPNVLKSGPKGLYIAPYGKMGTYNLGMSPSYSTIIPVTAGGTTTDMETTLAFDVQGKMDVKAFGVQIGHQFLLLKKLAINLYMFGPGVSFFTIRDVEGSISYSSTGTVQVDEILQDQAAQDAAIQSYIDKLGEMPFIGKTISKQISEADIPVEVGANNTTSFSINKVTLNYIPRMRMGLSIGFAF